MPPPPGQVQRATSKFIVFEHFEKMNTQSVRQALSEKELSWLENLQPVAPNNLTTVPGPASALTNISENIVSEYFANFGIVDYIISFTSVGSGWATNIATGVATRFAPPGTFSNPDMTVWNSSVVLINDLTSSYSAWNGTVFVRKGGVSPVINLTNGGTGYTSAPSVSITGGSGTGVTAVATIGSPQVTAVNIITGGTQYGPAPAVVFTGGGGSGAVANAIADPRGVQTITVTHGGTYANQNPLTTSFVGGGGTAAAAFANLSLGGDGFWHVTSISLNATGHDYSSTPAVSITGGSVVFGDNATATCTVGDGRLLSITVTNGGSGYTSAPAVSFTGGGSGSGATAAAVVGGSGVATVSLTNPGSGYLPSDSLTVVFSGGGGTGAAANAHVWPSIFSGNTVAVFGGRVWLAGGSIVQYTGTGGYDDFDAAHASATFTINDADLVHSVVALRSYNNYLYIFGDQSVKQIGNISLNAAGNITLFTLVTLSSDQGTIYPRSCVSFNRVTMFANTNGVYAVLGSSVQKISDDLDGIFKLIDFTQQPQAAIIDINGIHNVAWLVRYKDPLASTRSILLTFNGKKWFVCSQGDSLTAIATASTLASGKTLTFASSGQDLTQIMANTSTPVTFKLQTALTHHGNAVQRKKAMRGGVAATAAATVSAVLTLDTNEGTQSYTRSLTSGFQALSWSEDGSGRYLGATITGTLANFTLTNATIEYQETNIGNQ